MNFAVSISSVFLRVDICIEITFRTGGVAQVVQHLSSNPSTAREREREREITLRL
jgi:hypothetical protein